MDFFILFRLLLYNPQGYLSLYNVYETVNLVIYSQTIVVLYTTLRNTQRV